MEVRKTAFQSYATFDRRRTKMTAPMRLPSCTGTRPSRSNCQYLDMSPSAAVAVVAEVAVVAVDAVVVEDRL